MSSAEIPDKKERLELGLRNLQKAFLVELIMGIVVAPFSLFYFRLTFFSPFSSHPISVSPEFLSWILFFWLVASIISLAGVVIVFYFLYRGFNGVSSEISGTQIGAWGAVIKLIGSIISVLFTLFMIFYFISNRGGEFLIEDFLMFISFSMGLGIIGLIGAILIGIALYKIGDEYDNTLVTIGGILYIFLSWIGAILVFVGLGEIIKQEPKKASARAYPPPPPPPV